MDSVADALEAFSLVFDEFKVVCRDEIRALAEVLVDTFKSGNKLLICGNGGSAADSQHFAAELISSFSRGLQRPSLPAIALTVDTSVITAISNDFSFDMVFQRQIEGLGQTGDALLAISTSGSSKNCILAFEAARQKGMRCLALTRKSSLLHEMADYAVGVPSNNTQHIQECHLVTFHLLASVIDQSIV